MVKSSLHERLKTFAGIAGNVLEWYDFAVFGFFSDVLGKVFFPKGQSQDLGVMESFAVFGGAFLTRPIGGIVIGYIGDVSGRKKALEISIFLMAIATTCMGLLPTYDQIGGAAIFLLLIVRMLQGLSVGGQLMSSLVFTVEGHPRDQWGLYGSCVMAAGNFGTFLGGSVAFALRQSLTEEQLYSYGWRLPFLSGCVIAFCGLYLRYYCEEDEILPGHTPVPTVDDVVNAASDNDAHDEQTETMKVEDPKRTNPLRLAFSKGNRRSLFASAMVPMVWSGGFYLCFVWMAIYMQDLIDPPISSAFAINSSNLLLLCAIFPVAGFASDYLGRKLVMTVGGVGFGILGPLMVIKIGKSGDANWVPVFISQFVLTITLTCWGAPMCAWLVEAFEPSARLTSVSIGYNVAQALAGGMSPFIATLIVDEIGGGAPGLLLATLSFVSMCGLWCVASPLNHMEQDEVDLNSSPSLELREIS